MAKFEMTKSQKELVGLVKEWYDYSLDQDFVYTGAAGTGKTAIIPYIVQELGLYPHEVIYAAYTGKATSVLMQKGFSAKTIHSAFYDILKVPLRDKNGKKIKKNGRELITYKFRPKDHLPGYVKLIYLDEWSMVNNEFADVIYSFGIPIIASGDIYQLKPVFGRSPFYDRVKYELTEITRQSKDSGIIQLATLLRNGEELPRYCNFCNDAHVMSKKFLNKKHLLDSDIILVPKNKTRTKFNNKLRELKGSGGKLPQYGDKMICRKNIWDMTLKGIPLVNGILGKVASPIRRSNCRLNEGYYSIDFQPDYCYNTSDIYEDLECDYNWLCRPLGSNVPEEDMYNTGAKLEFAEAITVHLSQGSQYGKVVYWDEPLRDREMTNQLRYTAITRATDKVWMFID